MNLDQIKKNVKYGDYDILQKLLKTASVSMAKQMFLRGDKQAIEAMNLIQENREIFPYLHDEFYEIEDLGLPLSNLNTVDKTSLVNAINEVNTLVSTDRYRRIQVRSATYNTTGVFRINLGTALSGIFRIRVTSGWGGSNANGLIEIKGGVLINTTTIYNNQLRCVESIGQTRLVFYVDPTIYRDEVTGLLYIEIHKKTAPNNAVFVEFELVSNNVITATSFNPSVGDFNAAATPLAINNEKTVYALIGTAGDRMLSVDNDGVLKRTTISPDILYPSLRVLGGNNVTGSNNLSSGSAYSVKNASMWAQSQVTDRFIANNHALVNFSALAGYGFTLAARNRQIGFSTEENGVNSEWFEFYHTRNFDPATKTDTKLSNLVSDLTNAEKTTIQTKLGVVGSGNAVPYNGADKAINFNTQSFRIGGDFIKSETTFNSNYLTNSTSVATNYRKLENVAVLSRGSDTTTIGDIIITLPIGITTQWSAEIDIHQTSLDRAKIIISAYNTNSTGRKVTLLSGFDWITDVRFGRMNNSTVLVIKRNTGTSTFSYGKVNISTFYHSVSYYTTTNVKENYKVEFLDESTLTDFVLYGTVNQSAFERDTRYSLADSTLKVSGNGIATNNIQAVNSNNVRNASMYLQTSALNRPNNSNASMVNFTPLVSGGNTGGFDLAKLANTDSYWLRGEVASVKGNWVEIWHSGNFTPSNYYTKNESLGLFVGLTGVQTIANTKTFSSSPIIPNATLNNHAVNLGQVNGLLGNYLVKDAPNLVTSDFNINTGDSIFEFWTGTHMSGISNNGAWRVDKNIVELDNDTIISHFNHSGLKFGSAYLNANNTANINVNLPITGTSEKNLAVSVNINGVTYNANPNGIIDIGNYVTVNGVQTINSSKTFTSSPIIPNGTLNNHAVNLGQMNASIANALGVNNGLEYYDLTITGAFQNILNSLPTVNLEYAKCYVQGRTLGIAIALKNSSNNDVSLFGPSSSIVEMFTLSNTLVNRINPDIQYLVKQFKLNNSSPVSMYTSYQTFVEFNGSVKHPYGLNLEKNYTTVLYGAFECLDI